jgi:hypothetical protein
MNRTERRNSEKALAKLMKAAPDGCMVCGKEFDQNSKTFGGMTHQEMTVPAGECCAHTLEVMLGQGIYLKRNSDGLLTAKTNGTKKSASSANVKSVVGTLQEHFTKLDMLSNTIFRQGGLTPHPTNVSVTENPWKSDDAAWFASHPKRSHRLRPLEEEAATLPARITSASIPEKHRLEILVRQVQVGARIRCIFIRNTEFPFPDTEEVNHAIFDVVAQPGKQGMVVRPDEIAALARKYGGVRSSAAH